MPTVNPTHEVDAQPKAFFSEPFVELHMLCAGERPSAKSRCFRIRRSPENDARVQRMVEVGQSRD